jgi:hypothetical protein
VCAQGLNKKRRRIKPRAERCGGETHVDDGVVDVKVLDSLAVDAKVQMHETVGLVWDGVETKIMRSAGGTLGDAKAR